MLQNLATPGEEPKSLQQFLQPGVCCEPGSISLPRGAARQEGREHDALVK